MKFFCGGVCNIVWEQYKTFPKHKRTERKYPVIEKYIVKLSVQLAPPIKPKFLKAKVDRDILQ